MKYFVKAEWLTEETREWLARTGRVIGVMGRAARANPTKPQPPSAVTEEPARPYQAGDLKAGDVVSLGNSPTRWRVDEVDGVITLCPIRRES